jgi:putative transport protein
MIAWLQRFLVNYPELTLFLVISVGYAIGNLKFRGFGLGPVTGSLFAGILLGQIVDVPIADMTKSFLFLLFLFGIGYSVGPQFMQALKKDGLKPLVLAVGHTPAVPIGHILLTTWGAVIVGVIAK